MRFGELRGLRVRDVTDDPLPALVVPLTDLVRPVVIARAANREPDDLLFPTPEGGFLHGPNWRRAVDGDTSGRGRLPHDLRHNAASLWICAGVDIKTVSSRLWHSSTKLTLDTYGHLSGTWEPKHSARGPPQSTETLF
ncbi:MAG: site-specific integrase [Ornithinimicrobium sp.]